MSSNLFKIMMQTQQVSFWLWQSAMLFIFFISSFSFYYLQQEILIMVLLSSSDYSQSIKLAHHRIVEYRYFSFNQLLTHITHHHHHHYHHYLHHLEKLLILFYFSPVFLLLTFLFKFISSFLQSTLSSAFSFYSPLTI